MFFKDYFAKILILYGVDTIFTLPAYYITELICSFRKQDINVIEFKSEFSAGFAAAGYSIIKNYPGILCVNTGPSILNSLTSIKTAYKEQIPLIIIVGVQELNKCNNEIFFQSINIDKFNIKKIYTLNLDNLEIIRSCFNDALSYPRGPVILKIPETLLKKHVYSKFTNIKLDISSKKLSNSKLTNDVKNFLNIIYSYKKVIFLFGKGAFDLINTSYLDDFPYPFVTTLIAKPLGMNSNNYFGVIGILGDKIANHMLMQSDCIVSVGCRMSERSIIDSSIYTNKKLIIININGETCIQNEIKDYIIYKYLSIDFIKIMLKYIDLKKTNTYIDKENFNISVRNKFSYSLDTIKFTTTTVVRMVYSLNLSNAIYCIDDGTYTLPALKYFTKERVIFSGSMAVGGQSIGASIGAWYADTTSHIIIFIGDGGILSVIGELQTIAYYNIPVLIILINNHGYESIRQWFKDNYNETFGNIDFVSISRGFGINSRSIYNAHDLLCEINDFHFTQPLLLNVYVENENFECHFKMKGDL